MTSESEAGVVELVAQGVDPVDVLVVGSGRRLGPGYRGGVVTRRRVRGFGCGEEELEGVDGPLVEVRVLLGRHAIGGRHR